MVAIYLTMVAMETNYSTTRQTMARFKVFRKLLLGLWLQQPIRSPVANKITSDTDTQLVQQTD